MTRSNRSPPQFQPVFDLDDYVGDLSVSPVIKLTNMILAEALDAGAQRIHISFAEPDVGTVRWYVSDEWHEIMRIPKPSCSRVANRLGVMANLDLWKKVGQQGALQVSFKGRLLHLTVFAMIDPNAPDDIVIDCPSDGRH